jgi:hypothetical protein
MTIKETKKVFWKKTKNRNKTEKKRPLFSKPKPIPTENRHLGKKPILIPTDLKKSSPQGSSYFSPVWKQRNFQWSLDINSLSVQLKLVLSVRKCSNV